MPEVVYPSGNRNSWSEVFPELAGKECDDWTVINDILFGIAMNNRFGGKSVAEYRQEMTENVEKQLGRVSLNAKTEKDRLDAKRAYDMYQKYIPLVFDNLGGAYREYK